MTNSPTPNALTDWWEGGARDPKRPLLLIAGPCVLEDEATNMRIAERAMDAAHAAGMVFAFKASFDKANRSSVHSNRGPGLEEGLAALESIRRTFDVPVVTDVHEAAQAERCSHVVDLLQIPAFLCRQTDLLVACGATGLPVNVKKGQFLSPAEMRNVLEKLRDAGATNMMACERGTFFGYNRLVNDFIGFGDLADVAAEFNAPVCFDVTHSTQLPGGEGSASGGRPDRAAMIARAAVAAGTEALFIECHPSPCDAASDKATVLNLDDLPDLLTSLSAIRNALPGS